MCMWWIQSYFVMASCALGGSQTRCVNMLVNYADLLARSCMTEIPAGRLHTAATSAKNSPGLYSEAIC